MARARVAKPKRGRPPLTVPRDASPLYLRLTADERESCELAAQREGKTLSEWARNALLLRAAGRATEGESEG